MKLAALLDLRGVTRAWLPQTGAVLVVTSLSSFPPSTSSIWANLSMYQRAMPAKLTLPTRGTSSTKQTPLVGERASHLCAPEREPAVVEVAERRGRYPEFAPLTDCLGSAPIAAIAQTGSTS